MSFQHPRSTSKRRGVVPAIGVVLLALAALGGCQRSGSPEDVAITFIELYIVKVDQKSALELADGPAAEKLRAEIADVAQARPAGGSFSPDPRRPPISRKLISTEREGDDNVVYTYQLEVRPKGGVPLKQKFLVHVARRGDRWRVVDFQFWSDSRVWPGNQPIQKP